MFLTLSNKDEKYLCNRFVCLSVRPSVCLRSTSRKYSSNILKLIYVIHIWHSINCIENGMHKTNDFSTEAHKGFPIHYGLWGKMCKAYFKIFRLH